MPGTIPVDDPIVAIDGSALLQVPPEVVDASAALLPTHNVVAPVIAAGAATTVTSGWDRHPPTVYLIPVLPLINVLNTPVVLLMVPTLGLVLIHVPPDGVPVAVCVIPAHTGLVTLTVGVGFTVILRVT